MKMVVYADGSIIGNGQKDAPGGWAALIVAAGRERIISGHEYETTNNRMEMQAVIEGIRFTRTRAQITIYSDSEYVIKGFTEGRVEKWAASDFKKKKYGKPGTTPILNADLWVELNRLDLFHEIEWVHIRGHASKDTLNESIDAWRQQVCHEWAFSEAKLAELRRSKGVMGIDIPKTLEGRLRLIDVIRELPTPPDPPASAPREHWVVKRRAKPSYDAPLEDEIFFIPMSPAQYEDRGKAECEKAAETMNKTDDTKGMPKFNSKYIPRYVAVEISERREDGSTAA